jgi:hypothetical protein
LRELPKLQKFVNWRTGFPESSSEVLWWGVAKSHRGSLTGWAGRGRAGRCLVRVERLVIYVKLVLRHLKERREIVIAFELIQKYWIRNPRVQN